MTYYDVNSSLIHVAFKEEVTRTPMMNVLMVILREMWIKAQCVKVVQDNVITWVVRCYNKNMLVRSNTIEWSLDYMGREVSDEIDEGQRFLMFTCIKFKVKFLEKGYPMRKFSFNELTSQDTLHAI